MFKSIYSLPVFIFLAATMQIASEPIDEKVQSTSKHQESEKSSYLIEAGSQVFAVSQDDNLIESTNQVEETIPSLELPASIAQKNSLALKNPATAALDENVNNAIRGGHYQQLLDYEKKKEIDQERVFQGLLHMVRNIQPRAAACKIFHNEFIPYCKKNKLLGHLDSLDDKIIEELQKHAIQDKNENMFKNTLEVNNFVSERTVAYLTEATKRHCNDRYKEFPDRKKACDACNKITTMIDKFGKRENKES